MDRRILIGCLMFALAGRSGGQEPADDVSKPVEKAIEEDLAMKTLGGRQFWGDLLFFRGWHIQQNVFTKHYRLLDPQDKRHAWGSLDDCKKALETIRTRDNLPPMSGKAAILIHGILRSSKCMSSMSVAAKEDGYETILFDYPSTQVSIPDAAEFLHSTISSLDGIEEIYIVCHSMGGLVTRAYFAEHADPRIKRVVMIGTPNHGAELADLLHQNYIVRFASGPGGRQLVTDREGLIPSLPIPKCEFAVIAGARGKAAGWNPFIPGDDDGTVTVESTRLIGAADFSTVSTLHTSMLRNPVVVEQAMRFLKQGQLVADRPCQPITEPTPTPMPEVEASPQ